VAIERRAARVLLLSERSVLLIKGFDPGRPDAGVWWITPGGGVDHDEALEAAAAREVYEETGFRLAPTELGPIVATRVAEFDFEHRRFRQTEYFFAVAVASFTPRDHGWDDLERRSLLEQRWWSIEELRVSNATVYPSELADLVEAVLDQKVTDVIHLSGS
jgi:8-oxo-dGTP pyrophosphatase MutT (NUDIX family)